MRSDRRCRTWPVGRRRAAAPTPSDRCQAGPFQACLHRACPGRAYVGAAARQSTGYLDVETPRDCSIFVTMPVSGSKNCLVTAFQPPRLVIVNRLFGVGNLSAPGTPEITGR